MKLTDWPFSILGMSPEEKRNAGWLPLLAWLCVAGLCFVAVYALGSLPDFGAAMTVATAGFLIAGGSLLVGALTGFLFGIPRTLQESGTRRREVTVTADEAAATEETVYRANTNLEQISDWLTKIMVGVGLTQVTSLGERLHAFGEWAGPALGGSPPGNLVAVAVAVSYLVCGFLGGYLWTRLFLAGALAQADLESALRRLEEQPQIDAKALSLAQRYLDGDATQAAKVDVTELRRAIEKASASVKVQIFYGAERVRRTTWSEARTKPLMERTIPVFRALADSDKDGRFHANHGQLGFALKDQLQPDWAAAERELSRAIEIRGDDPDSDWRIYEFNRCVCRIRLDPAFAGKQPSDAETRARILADLRVVHGSEVHDYLSHEPVKSWMQVNKVTRKSLG